MVHSLPAAHFCPMKAVLLALTASAIVAASGAIGFNAMAAEPRKERVCFSVAETRAQIAQHQLAEPFRAMRAAAQRYQGEALNAKLCRWSEDYAYVISLLKRDGHLIHVFMDAADGQVVGTHLPAVLEQFSNKPR
jgi:uncharacterized membrane protein YkoI